MNANELMIGDWVWTSGHPVKIETILRIEVGYLKQYHKEFEFIDPVPLTEEMLKANGFRESFIDCGCHYFPEMYQGLNNRGFAVEADDNGKFWITDHQLMKIRYVHEFQHALRLCGLNELADNFKIE